MKFAPHGLLMAALTLWAGQAHAANTLAVNGSFEQTGASAVFTGGVAPVSGPDSTAITGWAVSNAAQFQINRNYDASAGKTSVELSGTGSGIFTTIDNFVVGSTYSISFDLSGNPDATVNPIVKVTASDIGEIDSFTYDSPVGQTAGNMGWARVATNFIATNRSHRISFYNGNITATNYFGPVIDNVFIGAAVPEPQDWVLFIIGLGMIGAVSRRRITQQAA